jgi:uncharacterized repeat protein (TIGR03803 family)
MKYFCAVASLLLPLFIQVPASSQVVNQVFSFSQSTATRPYTADISQGRDGALYSTASGIGNGTGSDGAAFRVDIGGKYTALHNFDGTDGQAPYAGLTLATDGSFYGTTSSGGSFDAGVLFKLTSGGTYTTLYQFAGGTDGFGPLGSPIQASDGNLYGTVDGDSVTSGVVYRYDPSSGVFSTIFSLSTDQSQGTFIQAPVVEGADGNLYGVAGGGGASGCGTIFEVSTAGALLHLYSFPCGVGGNGPAGPLLQASDGNFYGTTELGGITTTSCANGCGTVFKMSGSAVSTLYSFSGRSKDGQFPVAGLTEATDGNLYGTTGDGGTFPCGVFGCGTLYQISLSGQYKLLFSFVTPRGKGPIGGLLQHTNGKLYGTTTLGGASDEGTLYSLNMGLSPFIALVRYSGRIGAPVQILGQGLKGATAVTVNGVPTTSFKIVSDTYMTAVIPAGATTGPVVVTTATGSLTSNYNLRIVQ